MIPKSYLTKLASAVSKRSGICQATVEQVLPALFDEIRCRMTDDEFPCVAIESFGTFGVITKPEREYDNTYRGVRKHVHLEERRVMKFYPTRNLRQEIEARSFDPSRRSFEHHPDDPALRRRNKMVYHKMKVPIPKGQITAAEKTP